MTQVVPHNTPLFQLYLIGHRIGEVAHDYVPALKTWLNGKGIKNSYDSWHVKCTKTHIYYAMKNCNGDGEELRNYMVNIIDHYKGDNSKCHEDSRCHEEGYAGFSLRF